MAEQLGGKNDNQDRRKNRTSMGVVAGLAAGLAAGGASAQQAQDLSDFSGDSYSYTYGYTDNFEYHASEDALKTIDILNEKFGQKLSVTGEKYELIAATINAFVKAHPVIEGKTVTTKEGASSEPSYSPVADLQVALNQRSDEMNPLLLGLLMQHLNRIAKLSAPAKAE